MRKIKQSLKDYVCDHYGKGSVTACMWTYATKQHVYRHLKACMWTYPMANGWMREEVMYADN